MREHRFRQKYTEEQKVYALSCYLAAGSYKKAAEQCQIPWQSIALWKYRDPTWWQETIDKLNMEQEEQYRAGWRQVLTRSLDVMQDRLEHGNHKLVKVVMEDGQIKSEIVRVPVEAKDAVVIGAIAADKLRVSLGLPSRITHKVDDNDRLDALRKLATAAREARVVKTETAQLTLAKPVTD